MGWHSSRPVSVQPHAGSGVLDLVSLFRRTSPLSCPSWTSMRNEPSRSWSPHLRHLCVVLVHWCHIVRSYAYAVRIRSSAHFSPRPFSCRRRLPGFPLSDLIAEVIIGAPGIGSMIDAGGMDLSMASDLCVIRPTPPVFSICLSAIHDRDRRYTLHCLVCISPLQ